MITPEEIEALGFRAAQDQTEEGKSIAACLFSLSIAIQVGSEKLFEFGSMCQGFLEREAVEVARHKGIKITFIKS
jgi:hypothetical protein